jgi:hypothetical protein
MKSLHVVTILGCVCGGFVLIGTFPTATGAPRECAGAALAVSLAVIPYCFVRSIELWAERSAPEAELRKLNEILTTHTRLLAALANVAVEPKETTAASQTLLPRLEIHNEH